MPGSLPLQLHILLAEDRELIREALRPVVIGLATRVKLVECSSLEAALGDAGESEPWDLAVLSLHMEDMNGLSGLRGFRARHPDVPVVVLGSNRTACDIVRSLDYGAAGYLPESSNSRSIWAVLRLVLAGQRYVPADVLTLLESFHPPRDSEDFKCSEENGCPALTAREEEVLALLLNGLSNKEIARALGLQEVTVKLHLSKIFRKLGASNRTQAVRIALQNGWHLHDHA